MVTKKRAKELALIPDAIENNFGKVYSPVDDKTQHVWAEPQLFLLPFCVPQDKTADRFRSIKITETVKLKDQIKERAFKVNPDPELGLPGSFELEVMTGIYQLAADYMVKHGSVPEFLELGSIRSFLEKIGRPYSGKYAAILKEALKRLAATNCVSEGFFYSKPRDLYVIESFTFITTLQIAGETDFGGNTYERTRLKLHEFIRDNLNSNFRTLIDFPYLKSLRTSIAKPLSLHLAYRVFKNGKSIWEADYSWLAERLAIKVYSDIRRAKDQFRGALTELKDTGFLESWEWLEGWKIRFVAGPRLIQKHQERVGARDAWLMHQEQEAKQLMVIPRERKGEEQKKAYDPIAPLCAEYALKGWNAIAKKAHQKGFTEEALCTEARIRGHAVQLSIT